MQNQPQQPEQKPERVDELDVIGKIAMNIIKEVVDALRHLFSPRKVE